MCDATAIALSSLVIKAGSEVAGAIGQKKKAEQNEQESNQAFLRSVADLTARVTEERQAADERIREGQQQAAAAAATARVSAGESGVTGVSVDLLLGDIERQRGEQATSVRSNLAAFERQAKREERGLEATRVSRIRSVPKPNPFLTALRIGGAGLSFATQQLAPKPINAPRITSADLPELPGEENA